jgi:hypothetical protein
MVGIRSPDGLVVGSCTSHPGVLGSIPKREEPGKTGAPCVKVPGSSRVPGGLKAVMARRRRRRPPGGQTTAAGSGRLRAPFSTDNDSHTHTARSLACPLLTLSSSARSFSNGIFRSDGAPCARPLLPSSDRSAGQRNQPSHSTVLARPVCLFVCVSAASFPDRSSFYCSCRNKTYQTPYTCLGSVLSSPD